MTTTYCCVMYNVKIMIHHHRAETNELHVKLTHEHQKTEHQAAISRELDDRLRDTLKQLKVRV